jgi:hypothetical protein
MERGTIVKKKKGGMSHYVIECEDKYLKGSVNGVIDIDPETLPKPFVISEGVQVFRTINQMPVKFTVYNQGNTSNPIYVAQIVNKYNSNLT